MPLKYMVQQCFLNPEATYADAATALTGAQVFPVLEGGAFTYKRTKKKRTHAAGGFQGSKGSVGPKWGELKLAHEITPKTITNALSERPTAHPLLIASGFHCTAADESSQYRVRYRLETHDSAAHESSLSAKLQLLNSTNQASLESIIRGVRFNPVFKCVDGEAVVMECDGKGVNPTFGHQGSVLTPSSFLDEDPITHYATSVTMVAKVAGGDVAFAGELSDLEIRPNWTVETRKTANASNGVARVVLVPGRPQIDVKVVLETMQSWNMVSFQQEPALIELTVVWTSYDSSTDKVAMLATFDIGDEGLEVETNDEGEASCTMKGDIAWGLPGESHTNPRLSGLEWRWYTEHA